MKVEELKDIGAGKACAIIGGGRSLNGVVLSKIKKDITIISCNMHGWDFAQIAIYYDREAGDEMYRTYDWKQKIILAYDIVLRACHAERIPDVYSYRPSRETGIQFGDTGYHALQIADQILGFASIYLIGLDYSATTESYHHNEIRSDDRKLEAFIDHSIGRVLPKIEAYQPKAKVFIGSWPSAIKRFQHSRECYES